MVQEVDSHGKRSLDQICMDVRDHGVDASSLVVSGWITHLGMKIGIR